MLNIQVIHPSSVMEKLFTRVKMVKSGLNRKKKVVAMNFSPWGDYVRPLGHRGHMVDDCYSHRDFDASVLAKMESVVKEAGIVRRVWTDCPLVEASLLENGRRAVVALSNWSADERRKVRVTLAGDRVSGARSARGAAVRVSRHGNDTVLETETGWGDFIVLEATK